MAISENILLVLFLAGSLLISSQQDLIDPNDIPIRSSRMLKHGDPLEKPYLDTQSSIAAAEDFIRNYPDEKDLCAGALLNMAAIYNRENEKEKAIEIYQKAIKEYGNEAVPYVNSYFTVNEWALLHIGFLERDIGNQDKALEIFNELSKSSNFNIKNSARINYLSTMQSHLKLKATVSLPKLHYYKDEEIHGTVVVKNPEKEPITMQCFIRIRRAKGKSYGAIVAVPRDSREIVVAPGEKYKDTFVFTSRERLEPQVWVIDCGLNGVTVESNTLIAWITEERIPYISIATSILIAIVVLVIAIKIRHKHKASSRILKSL